MKIAFMFPGQGSQIIGMGKDLYENYEEARKIYDLANEILGIDVRCICFEGTEEELNKTENTQIAILTTSLAILEILKKYQIEPEYLTGLSLGEYTALIYGGYISLEQGLKLVQKRGYLMGNNLPEEEYSMAAVIGLDSKIIEEECSKIYKTGEFVVPANYNYSGQTVISGNAKAIDIVIEKLKEKGAKKVIKLNTSGPFHTEKLIKAKELYEKELEKVEFSKGKIKVIKNIDGTIYEEKDNIKEILAKHIINPVRFDKSIQLMKEDQIDTYIEIGPGRALTGFIKKELENVKTYNISNTESLENTIKEIK